MTTSPPDVILLPESIKQGDTMPSRVGSIADVAEPILGIDPAAPKIACPECKGRGKVRSESGTEMCLNCHGSGKVKHPRNRAYIRIQPGGMLFVSRDPNDMLCHPQDSPRAGQSRYRWETRENGFKYGWIIP